VGPSWMRPDASGQGASNANPGGMAGTPDPSLTNAPPPWQVPSEAASAENPPQPETVGEEKEGGFPVIIFVVLVLGIIIAIVAFLFTQGALPFIS